MLFEVSLIMNIVVVTVYWSLLHQESISDCGGDPLKILNVYWAHIVPGFSVAVNFAMTDVVMRSRHCKVIPIVATLYGIVNYYETKKRGKPLYFFLTWDDSSTIFIYGGLIAGFTVVFMGLSQLTVAIKRSITAVAAATSESKPGK
jgi:hypothetical protein